MAPPFRLPGQHFAAALCFLVLGAARLVWAGPTAAGGVGVVAVQMLRVSRRRPDVDEAIEAWAWQARRTRIERTQTKRPQTNSERRRRPVETETVDAAQGPCLLDVRRLDGPDKHPAIHRMFEDLEPLTPSGPLAAHATRRCPSIT